MILFLMPFFPPLVCLGAMQHQNINYYYPSPHKPPFNNPILFQYLLIILGTDIYNICDSDMYLGGQHHGFKLREIEKKKPVYIPPPPSDYEELSRLVYQGKDTDTEQLVKFMYKRMGDQGVLYTLVNRLYEMSINDIEFYVPELVYIGIKLDCKPILKFLVDSSQLSLRLFCLIYWNVQAFGFQMKDKSMEIRLRLNEYQKEIVSRMISSPHDIQLFGFQKPQISNDVIKTIRRKHCQYFLRFINKIVKTSIDLKKIDQGLRKQKLKDEIVLANKSLKIFMNEYKQYKIKTHMGIIIPFRREEHESFLSTMVVGIVENECTCFNTRKRVPYRIVLETIDPEELGKYELKNLAVSTARKAESVSHGSSADMFLEGIHDIDSISPIEIIKEADDDDSKFKDFDNFVTQTKQIERFHAQHGSNKQQDTTSSKMISRVSGNNQSQATHLKRNTIRRSKPFVDTPYIRQARSEIIEEEQGYTKQVYEKNLLQFQNFFPQKRPEMIKRTNSMKKPNRQTDNAKSTKDLQAHQGDNNSLRFSQRKIHANQRNEFLSGLQKNMIDQAIAKQFLSFGKLQSPEFDERDYDNIWVQEMGIRKFGPWEELWHDKVKRLKIGSVYSNFPSFKLRNVIVKGGDDLRQEIVCMQVITKIRDIFRNAGLSLYLRPYEIIVTSESSGILQFVTNGVSIDQLKKKDPQNFTSLFYFYLDIFKEKMNTAQQRFVESLAGYSILTYVLQIKDRHNGNLLIDYQGHIVHIDFGFIFASSPGNWNFESSPFKLTGEYIELLEGEGSKLFDYFKRLFFEGFNELRKHVDQICTIVDMMSRDSDLPCFQQFDMNVFRDRFKAGYSDEKMKEYCQQLIHQSNRNWRTIQYDYFQYLTNQIAQ